MANNRCDRCSYRLHPAPPLRQKQALAHVAYVYGWTPFNASRMPRRAKVAGRPCPKTASDVRKSGIQGVPCKSIRVSATRHCSRAIGGSTGVSSPRSPPPASTAGRCARRAPRNAPTSCSMPALQPPRRRASAPVGAAGRKRRRARRHGHSTEEEVRAILRNAVRSEEGAAVPLGTRLKNRFAGIGLEGGIPELRGRKAGPAILKK